VRSKLSIPGELWIPSTQQLPISKLHACTAIIEPRDLEAIKCGGEREWLKEQNLCPSHLINVPQL
jgi:hypothetical protein